MPKSRFLNASLDSILSVVPAEQQSLADLSDLYGSDAVYLRKLKDLIGLDKRHVAPEGVTAGDLCCEAADRLLERRNIPRHSIDALILVTQTPDYVMPCTAAVIHGQLGLADTCAAFDVNLGCSGYVYGLWLAFSLVQSKSASNVLLLAGDTMSRLVNPRDKSAAALFGDAGTASLITSRPDRAPSSFILGTNGRGFDKIIVPAGGFRQPKSDTTAIPTVDKDGNERCPEDFFMDGGGVFAFSTQLAPRLVKEVLAYAQLNVDDMHRFVFHQANKYIVSTIMRSLNLPLEKTPYDMIERYGNVSMASIPLALCDAPDTSARPRNLLFSGFGVGLSWGSAVLTDAAPVCYPVETYADRSILNAEACA